MTYKLTTKEDLNKAVEIYWGYLRSRSLTGTPVAFGDVVILAEKLMAERDSYRQVAMETLGLEKEGFKIVDAEAARIMEKESK